MYFLHEDDVSSLEDQSYFKIKLAYNGTNHYIPIVPRASQDFLDYDHEARYYIKQSRDALYKLSTALPPDSRYKSLVDIAYKASQSTCDILLGNNPLTGATRAVGPAEPALFKFPGYNEGSAAPKRKRPTATVTSIFEGPQQSDVPGTSTQSDFPSGLPETQKEDQPALLPDHSPKVTVTHSQLKKAEKQCFCGEMCASLEELAAHKSLQHIAKGVGTNPKTSKPRDLWRCSTCNMACVDNRACWKHYRTAHLKVFIHMCPVEGCTEGNDQKDTIVSHIIKDHSDQQEWVDKAYQQQWLRCRKCTKFFLSVKGKNTHETTCGEVVIKKVCVFEGCSKTYKAQSSMDHHVDTAHKGKGHKALCPICGAQFSAKQALDNHIASEHKD